MSSDYMKHDQPWRSPQRDRSRSRSRSSDTTAAAAASAPRNEEGRLRLANDALRSQVEACMQEIAALSSARLPATTAATAADGRTAKSDNPRRSTSPPPPSSLGQARSLPPPPLLGYPAASAASAQPLDEECRYLRSCLKDAEARVRTELAAKEGENAALRAQVERLSKAGVRSSSSSSRSPPRPDESASTEVLIDSIRTAFLKADKRSTLAATIADQLQRTEGKIALVTQENKRLQQKLERAIEKGDGYLAENRRLKRALVREASGAVSSGSEDAGVEAVAAAARRGVADGGGRASEALLKMQSAELERLKAELRTLREDGDAREAHAAEAARQRAAAEAAEVRAGCAEAASGAAQRELAAAREELEAATRGLSQARADVHLLQGTKDDLVRDNAKLSGQLRSAQVEVDGLEQEVSVRKSTASTQTRVHEEEVLKLRTSLSTAEASLEQAQSQLRRADQHSKEVDTSAHTTEEVCRQKLQRLEADRDACAVRNRELEAALAELRRSHAEVEARAEVQRRALEGAASKDAACARQAEAAAAAAKASFEPERAELRRTIDALEAAASQRKEAINTERDQRIESLQRSLAEAQAEVTAVRESAAKVGQSLSSEKEAAEKYRSEQTKTAAEKAREVDLLHMSRQQEVAVLQSKLEQEKQRHTDYVALMDSKHSFVVEESTALKLDKTRLVEQNRTYAETNAVVKEELRAATLASTEKDQTLAQERAQRIQAESHNDHYKTQMEDLRHQLSKKETEARELLKGLQQQSETTSLANQKRNEVEGQMRDLEVRMQKDRTRHELFEKQRHTELDEFKQRNRHCEEQLHLAQQRLCDMEELYREQQSTVQDMLRERQDEHRTVLEPLKEKTGQQRTELHALRERAQLLERQVEEQRGKMADRNTRAYDEQLSLSAQLQDREKESAVLRARLADTDGENRRLAAEIEEAQQVMYRLQQTSIEDKARLDRVPFIEIKLAEAEERCHSRSQELETYAESHGALAAELDMKRQEAADRSAEVTELRHSVGLLKNLCSQHEREAGTRLDQLSPGTASPVAGGAAASHEQLAAEKETLAKAVGDLSAALQEEKRRCEDLMREVRAKELQAQEHSDDSLREQAGLRNAHIAGVALQGVVLSKLHAFATQVAAALRLDVDHAFLGTLETTAGLWRTDPASWELRGAQDTFHQVLGVVLRCVDAIKKVAGEVHARSRSRSPPRLTSA